MKKLFIIFLSCSLLLSACARKYDNYAAPNAGITGKIVDAATGESFYTEQPNGVRIRLLEAKYGTGALPQDVWAKPDGTFANAALFKGQYTVSAIEGAFFPVAPQTLDITGTSDVTFKVVPYLKIAASVTPAAGKVTVSYQISSPQAQTGSKIADAKIVLSAYPYVSNTIYEKVVAQALTAVPDATVLASTYTGEITGLTPGQTYYVRVAARTNNTLGKYNYTQVYTVKIP